MTFSGEAAAADDRGEVPVPSEALTPEPPARAEVDVPAALLDSADDARLAGDAERATRLLRELVRNHPRDSRAPMASFTLGRIYLNDLGDPARAATAFARARALRPHGPLSEAALAYERSHARAPAMPVVRADARATTSRLTLKAPTLT